MSPVEIWQNGTKVNTLKYTGEKGLSHQGTIGGEDASIEPFDTDKARFARGMFGKEVLPAGSSVTFDGGITAVVTKR